MTATPSAAAVARIEASFTDTCTITGPSRPGTEADYDPDTLVDTPVAGDLVYEGPCLLTEAGRGTSANTTSRGGTEETEHPYQLSIPRTETGVSPGQQALVTTSMATVRLQVRRVRHGTYMARRILLCDLVEAVAQ